MKKWLVLLLIFTLACLPAAPAMAGNEKEPYRYTSGDYEYTLDEFADATIAAYNGSEETVVIPTELDGYPVREVGVRAFYFNDALLSISLPDSVEIIGDEAFSNCSNLASITLSDNLYIIGSEAFNNCVSLASVNLSGSVMSIGYKAFYCCESLTSVVLPSNLRHISRSAFAYCSALTSVTIFYGPLIICSQTFQHCPSLQTVNLPNSLTYIVPSAFEGCDALTLIVPQDSCAEEYAVKNGIPYQYADTAKP